MTDDKPSTITNPIRIAVSPVPPPGQPFAVQGRKVLGVMRLAEGAPRLAIAAADGSVNGSQGVRLGLVVEDDWESTMDLVVLPTGAIFSDDQIEYVLTFTADEKAFHVYKHKGRLTNIDEQLDRLLDDSQQ